MARPWCELVDGLRPIIPVAILRAKDSFESEEDMEQFCSYLAGN